MEVRSWDRAVMVFTKRFAGEFAMPMSVKWGLDPQHFDSMEAFQIAFTNGASEFLESMGKDPHAVDTDFDAVAEKLWFDGRTDIDDILKGGK